MSMRVCVCLCIYLLFYAVFQTSAAVLTRLDLEMLHHDFLKPVYFGVKRSSLWGTKNKYVGGD